MQKNIIVSTVGTSFKRNLENMGFDLKDNSLLKQNVKKLFEYSLSERVLGAEVNSINSLMEENLIDNSGILFFMISDTDDGRYIGKVLELFFSFKHPEYNFKAVHIVQINDLNDKDVYKFKNKGLKNLVKEISKIVRKFGNERLLINATGGYKAQIAFAAIIGQTLQIPVAYLFEKFSKIITLPPQPISFDFEKWTKSFSMLHHLNQEGILDEKELNRYGDPLQIKELIDSIDENGTKYIELSPIGQLFFEKYFINFSINKGNYLPEDHSGEKKIIYEDKNEKKHKGLDNYLQKILKLLYCKKIGVFYYNKSGLPEKNRFYISKHIKTSETIEGIFTANGATSKFLVYTTATNNLGLEAVLIDLTDNFII